MTIDGYFFVKVYFFDGNPSDTRVHNEKKTHQGRGSDIDCPDVTENLLVSAFIARLPDFRS